MTTRELPYHAALAEALDDVLSQDQRVTLIGAGFTGFMPGGRVQMQRPS